MTLADLYDQHANECLGPLSLARCSGAVLKVRLPRPLHLKHGPIRVIPLLQVRLRSMVAVIRSRCRASWTRRIAFL
jgi:hypothetical protein